MRVAFQGERGAFSETAAQRLLGSDVETIPCHTFEDMFDAVSMASADACVAPIENSLAGSIHRNYDLLLAFDLTIAAETHLRISHALVAPPDVALDGVRNVLSHPVALAQCTRIFRSHPHLQSTPVHDTAGAVRMVMERGRSDEAAIASAAAAQRYGAHILLENVEDNPQNYTRFLLLTRHGGAPKPQEPVARWKTSLVMRVANRPGALYRALGAFAMHEIDLAKIESRPIEGRPWEYAFYLDIIGNPTDPKVDHALGSLRHMADMVKILGSYPTRW
jgi:prephenate dehydratase